MFKLHRHRSDKSADRIEFKFSNFRAAQVPKGWDKIFISLVCVDNGKSIAKTGRAVVRNGACHWPDSISEFISFYQDLSTKEIEECQYRFVVLMGSTKSTILGETALNLTDYLSSTDPSVISSPLQKSNLSTTLQFNVQCLSTKSKLRGPKSAKDSSSHGSHREELNTGNDSKSDGSATPDELGNREASLSASESHCSSNSGDMLIDRTTFSPQNTSSNFGGSGSFTKSNGMSQLASPLGGSTRDLLEAAEETIEELRDEAKMWERHSRKVKVEMENLKRDYAEKAKQLDEIQMELSSSNAERELLKQEVEQLKSSLEESRASARESFETPKYDDMISFSPKYDDLANSYKELEGELEFQKESNANLTLQMKKTQEANVELLAIVQELEEAVEAQNLEISGINNEHEIKEKDEEIAVLKEKLAQAVDRSSRPGADSDMSQGNSVLERENEALKAKIHELERDCAELTDENLDLLYKLKDISNGDVTEISRRDPTEASQLNEFEIKCAELEIKLQGFTEENDKLLKKLRTSEKEMIQKNEELSELRERLTFENASFSEKLEESKSETIIDSLKEEIEILTHSNSELEKKNGELEETIEILRNERSNNSTSLEKLKRDIDSHVASNKVLERKSKDLELAKNELELQITELEQENIQLSERISGLEAQSRYLTDEKESNQAQLEDCRSLIQELKEKAVRQQAEVEQAKLENREKLQEANEKFIQAQEEVEVLRRSNTKVQSTVEGLIEECSTLQSLNSNLRKQKVELHESVTRLNLQLEESQKKCVEFSRRVENLEGKLMSLQIDALSKEQSILSELESLLEEHKEQEEKITWAHQALSKLEVEKAVEVESLERETEVLNSDNLRIKTESELEILKRESKDKIQGLVGLLNASKQSEAMLMADIEHMRSLLESTRSNEENLNKKSNELEVRLKSSDYEKKQILEEIAGLKSQVQRISQLQEEISSLKSSIDKTKFEKGKLEEKLKSISDECEELRREKEALAEKVGSMEKALNSGEDERKSKTVLEAKLVRLQSDLSLKDAAGAVEAELKNEINRMKRSNNENQRRIQSLEQEKEELLRSQGGTMEEDNNKPTQERRDMPRVSSPFINSEGKIAALEAELKEMKERYSNMSLQYAQVEAEREELVQKLKSNKSTAKRWFS